MSPNDPATATPDWPTQVRAAFARYDEPLLRGVAHKLIKPRNQWPIDDLIDRMTAALENAPVVDRRLKDLSPACRKLLAVIGHSRQPRWRVGHLVALLTALGHEEGAEPVLALCEEGLLYPVLPPTGLPLRSFEAWLIQTAAGGPEVFTFPLVASRARGEDLGLPELPTEPLGAAATREADGLDWLLRMAVVWQNATEAPFRLTQSGDFFKRDLTRLRADAALTAPTVEHFAEVPDPGLLAVALGTQTGVLAAEDGELRAKPLPWGEELAPVLTELAAGLPRLEAWHPVAGWIGPDAAVGSNVYPGVYLLALLLLARQPESAWVRPADVQAWVAEHHPLWQGESRQAGKHEDWAAAVLLGLLFGLKLTQAAKDSEGEWRVRLSPWGRWLYAGAAPPPTPPPFRQTLLVQPNFEVLVYRQGLTPRLVADLTRFARWKGLGSACTLELEAGQVYRGLEAGATLVGVQQCLTRHGMRPVPDNVAEALKTWANKRERIVVYPRATLLEFATSADLDTAISRGLVQVRLTDRLGLVSDEGQLPYKHLRLTGTRDYAAAPEPCVEVAEDGVTLTVDVGRADLLLDSEMVRVAEPQPIADGRRVYRLTPASLRAALKNGMTLQGLDDWFRQRTGAGLTPAARLLAAPEPAMPAKLERLLVLEMPTEELADGLEQWPGTCGLLVRRLGPKAFLIDEADAPRLSEQLTTLGLTAGERLGT